MRHASNRASEVGHPCLRYHAAGRLVGHIRPPIDPALEGICIGGRSCGSWLRSGRPWTGTLSSGQAGAGHRQRWSRRGQTEG